MKPSTIFLETLIHDFDTLNFFNPGARPTQVYAVADALVRPDFRDKGLLNTAVVTIRYDNGAIATAEANFQAVYSCDVRGEVFGSARMLTAGDARTSELVCYGVAGISQTTQRSDAELLRDAYLAEMRAFVDAQGDVVRQLNQVQNFLAQNVDAVIVLPVDTAAATVNITRAATIEKVPLVYVNRRPDDPKLPAGVVAVASDDLQAGQS